MFTALILAAVVAAAAPEKIAVFVALPEAGGFVDAAASLVESRKQLNHEVQVRKRLRAVARREDADIVITIVRREFHSERDGGAVAVAAPIGSVMSVRPTYDSTATLVTTLEVGDFKRTIEGRFQWRSDAWQECAERVAKEVEAWAEANHERLVARRAGQKP